MNYLCLIFFIYYFIFIESSKIQQNFDEIFGEGWNNKNESEEEMIKTERTDLNEQNENLATVDQMSDQMGNDPNDQQKREIIKKFEAIKEKLKQKGKYQRENNNKIERKIGKLLGTNREKIYKWKKEMNLNKKNLYEQKKYEFIERINEFKFLYAQGKQKEFVKELGISEVTFIKWKKELLPNYNKTPNKYTNEDKLTKMKQYFKIVDKDSEISDIEIAKELAIGLTTLKAWKKKFSSFSGI